MKPEQLMRVFSCFSCCFLCLEGTARCVARMCLVRDSFTVLRCLFAVDFDFLELTSFFFSLVSQLMVKLASQELSEREDTLYLGEVPSPGRAAPMSGSVFLGVLRVPKR